MSNASQAFEWARAKDWANVACSSFYFDRGKWWHMPTVRSLFDVDRRTSISPRPALKSEVEIAIQNWLEETVSPTRVLVRKIEFLARAELTLTLPAWWPATLSSSRSYEAIIREADEKTVSGTCELLLRLEIARPLENAGESVFYLSRLTERDLPDFKSLIVATGLCSADGSSFTGKSAQDFVGRGIRFKTNNRWWNGHEFSFAHGRVAAPRDMIAAAPITLPAVLPPPPVPSIG